MLREFGVKGVKVQEVVSLEDEMLEFLQYAISRPFLYEFLNASVCFQFGLGAVTGVLTAVAAATLTSANRGDSKPVYGLIFLFRWKEDDPDKQEQSCPEGLWFANQVCFLFFPYALAGANLN